MKKKLLGLFLAGFSVAFSQGNMTPLSTATTAGSDWETTTLTADFAFDFPWEITYGPDDKLWLTERVGEKIVRISTTGGAIETLIDLSSKVANSKQGGLMGMAIHPDLYANIATTTNNYVYAAYSYENSGLKLRFVRLVYNHNTGVLTEDTSLDANGTLLEGLPASGDHNSGRLIIGPDYKLYYTIGDQGANQFDYSCNPVLSQVLPTSPTDYDNYPGKTLRLNLDGTIPSDNPILNGVQSHVNTYGHRNAQGIIFAKDGTLYASEHGAKVDDEINVIKSAQNYGWPEIAGYYDNLAYTYCNWSSLGGSCNAGSFSDHNCPSGAETATEYESYPTANDVPANFEPPIGTYGSTIATDPAGGWFTWPTIAPSGIDIHETNNIPGWGRSLLIPSLKKGTIYRAKLTADGSDIVNDTYEEFHSSNDRYRDIAISPDGLTIYAITDNSGGTSGPSSESNVSIENGGTIIKINYLGTQVTNPPVASCQDFILTLDADGNGNLLASDIDNGSTGGTAGLASITLDKDTFDCSHVGTTQTVWLTATDNDGNESRCSAMVTVNANASPNPFTTPTLEDVVSNCEVTVTAPTLINNACVEITATTTDPLTYSSGESGVITWLFNDGTNSDTTTQNVTVNTLSIPTNISIISGSNFANVTWDNIEDVSFNVRYREEAGAWTTINTINNAITLTGLSLLTNYELEISSDCGASESAYSATETFTTTDIEYCDTFGIVNSDNHHITRVELESINNSSNGSTYTDFTAYSTTLTASETYTINIDKSIPGDSWKTAGFGVWIDYNGDGDFADTDEFVAGTVAGTDLSPYDQTTRSFQFTVPSNITIGTARMRVAMMQYYTPYGGNEPCGIVNNDENSSEVEDYTINLEDNTLSATDIALESISIYPNPIKDNVVVKLPSAYNYAELTISLFDLQGRTIKQESAFNSQNRITLDGLNQLNSGVYFIRIQEGNKTLASKKLIKM